MLLFLFYYDSDIYHCFLIVIFALYNGRLNSEIKNYRIFFNTKAAQLATASVYQISLKILKSVQIKIKKYNFVCHDICQELWNTFIYWVDQCPSFYFSFENVLTMARQMLYHSICFVFLKVIFSYIDCIKLCSPKMIHFRKCFWSIPS